MLVLTRKKDETISIGPNIKVTVVRIKGKSVRIGIEAPKSLTVLRGELDEHQRCPATPQPIEHAVDCHRDRPCSAPLKEQLHRRRTNGTALHNGSQVDAAAERRVRPAENPESRPTDFVAGRRIAHVLAANGSAR